MIRTLLVFSVFLFSFCGQLSAQAVTANPLQLNFTAFENSPDSQLLTISNPLSRAVNVNGILFYDTYGVPAFSASEDHFTIAPSGNYTIWVKFSPRHNTLHNSEMVIINDGLRGYLTIDLIGQGKYSLAYYDSSENKSEEDLKSALHAITTTGYIALGYNFARDSMFMVLDNKKINGQGAAQNTIECIYTGREAVGYTDRSDCQTNFSFNTEHTFPQSYFNQLEPMKSDLHHLFPCDDLANNYRADNPFGIVTGGIVWSNGGSKASNNLFEPRDDQKGAAARALMYFVLRYQNYGGFFTSQESILRFWHHDFPAYPGEKKRNADIYLMQHNRNPFVDYPQFIERITSLTATAVAAVVKTIDIPQDTIIYGYVPAAVPVVFHFVIVNKGNAAVQLTNFNLTNAGFTFQSGGTDTLLFPGQTLGIDIQLIAQNSLPLLAFLNFETDDTSHQSVSIPIFANDSVFDGISELDLSALKIFPNPFRHSFVVDWKGRPGGSIFLYDNLGRLIWNRSVIQSEIELFFPDLEPGIYLLQLNSDDAVRYTKIVKE